MFSQDVKIDTVKLQFVPFTTESKAIRIFDCGNKDLNDFLCKDEVREYEKEYLGSTTLVYYNGALVAYYTLYNDTLRLEYFKRNPAFSKLSEYRIEGVPAFTIGRLAVDKQWQCKGVGRILMQRIVMFALDHSRQTGVRLILVQAKRDAFIFYEKLGFQFVFETKNEMKRFKARGTRTMYFDLTSLNYLKHY